MLCYDVMVMAGTETDAAALRVLVADDRADVLQALRLLLKGAGHRAITVDSPQALMVAAETHAFDLILMDLNYTRDTTSGQEGLELLARLQSGGDAPPIIVMTAWGNIDLAVEAMRRGACDFIQKPWDNVRLLAMLEKQAKQAAERRRMQRQARSELEIAHNVQQKLFPHETKRLANAQYIGRCLPAREVGGDYYDFLDLGPGRIGFVLADVSGKGIAAALLMANLQGCFRSQSENCPAHPAALLAAVNRLFREATPYEQYATAFFAMYDEVNRSLRYVNCGHLPPVLLRASGEVERLQPTATVLGVFKDWEAEEACVEVRSGDTLLVFSDGITEAGNERDDDFGEGRMLSLLRAGGASPLEAVVDSLIEAARAFGQSDDMTVLAVRGC